MQSGLFRFALFYFCYYGALGAYTPYIGRWVQSLGHGGDVVGSMLVLWYGSRIVAPPAWSALLRRSTRPGLWLVAGSALTLASFACFTQVHAVWPLLTVMAVFGLFYNALMPQFEAMTLAALGARTADYGRVRIWGSIGFLFVSGSYGWLLDRLGSLSFPWVMLPWLTAMVAAAWLHRHDRPPPRVESLTNAGHLWKRPGVRRFLLVALLMQMGFGAFYVFYTLHLHAQGYSGATIGLLWALGVAIEIMMFWAAPRLIARYGAQSLMSFCLAVTILRWTVTGLFAPILWLMFAAQLLHAFSFAAFHASCMRQISDLFPGQHAVGGESLYFGFSSGVGGVLGAELATRLWLWRGGEAAFLGSAVVVAIAWLVYALRRKTNPSNDNAAA